MMVTWEYIAVGDWQANCYVVTAGKEALLIDPGAEAERILGWLGKRQPKLIVLTHADHDHVGALDAVAEALKVPVWAHPAAQARVIRKLDRTLAQGERFTLGGTEWEVRHVPGHSPDGLALIGAGHCFSGDSLFPGGPGRTRSPEDFRVLLAAIERELLTLDPETQFHPGHGSGGTIGEAREAVAGFYARWKGEPLSGDVTWAEEA
jgi:hydroxyacylglutathione hydrolase